MNVATRISVDTLVFKKTLSNRSCKLLLDRSLFLWERGSKRKQVEALLNHQTQCRWTITAVTCGLWVSHSVGVNKIGVN